MVIEQHLILNALPGSPVRHVVQQTQMAGLLNQACPVTQETAA
jgi:hypothetical protein